MPSHKPSDFHFHRFSRPSQSRTWSLPWKIEFFGKDHPGNQLLFEMSQGSYTFELKKLRPGRPAWPAHRGRRPFRYPIPSLFW